MASGYPAPMVHLDIRLSSKPPWSIIVSIMCFISLLRAILNAHFGYSSLIGAHFYPIGSHIIISWVHKSLSTFQFIRYLLWHLTAHDRCGFPACCVLSQDDPCGRRRTTWYPAPIVWILNGVTDVSEGPVVGHLFRTPLDFGVFPFVHGKLPLPHFCYGCPQFSDTHFLGELEES